MLSDSSPLTENLPLYNQCQQSLLSCFIPSLISLLSRLTSFSSSVPILLLPHVHLSLLLPHVLFTCHPASCIFPSPPKLSLVIPLLKASFSIKSASCSLFPPTPSYLTLALLPHLRLPSLPAHVLPILSSLWYLCFCTYITIISRVSFPTQFLSRLHSFISLLSINTCLLLPYLFIHMPFSFSDI